MQEFGTNDNPAIRSHSESDIIDSAQESYEYLEESASGFLKMHINDILTKGKSKSEIQAKIKAMDKKYGDEGSKEYNKTDMLNALICACLQYHLLE